jgi:hypothetical protein
MECYLMFWRMNLIRQKIILKIIYYFTGIKSLNFKDKLIFLHGLIHDAASI